MNRKRKYTDDKLKSAVRGSTSIRQVLGKLGKATQGGGSYDQLKRDFKRLELDISHFTGKGHLKGKSHNWSTKIPLEKILIEDSTYCNGNGLKRRLLKEGFLINECLLCGQKGSWKNKKLIMVMDHINGINNDHRIENLRMLCPNCNSQQSTFAGRNKRREKQDFFCKSCDGKIYSTNKSGFCHSCYWKDKNKNKAVVIKTARPRKFEVTKEELNELIKSHSFCEIGRRYGVSDNAIRKRAKKYKII